MGKALGVHFIALSLTRTLTTKTKGNEVLRREAGVSKMVIHEIFLNLHVKTLGKSLQDRPVGRLPLALRVLWLELTVKERCIPGDQTE